MWQNIKNIYHLLIAALANFVYNFPSKKLIVIGVTGTDGKTTTTSLIYHIFNQAGYDASMISSVGATIGGKEYDVGFHVTTPSSFSLQQFIKKAATTMTKDKKYLVLETTSHALDQHRVFGVKFKIGVLTNVTHEHLDYHKTYEKYVEAKTKLLKSAEIAIVNRDDESYELIKSKINPSASLRFHSGQALRARNQKSKIITFGLSKEADINPHNFTFESNLIGEFNTYNTLAAVCACKALGIKDSVIKKAIKSFKPPIGREDIVYKNSFSVMIDFAHTPNAFDVILSAVRPMVKGRIIHVFGSAGKRDRTKRPIMGKISSKYSDVIILTAEDPRTELVENIDRDIEKGFNENHKLFDYKTYKNTFLKNIYFKIDNREKAIQFAINIAKKGDFVITTGKSHEKSMNYGKGEEPWDEYKTVFKALGKRHKSSI